MKKSRLNLQSKKTPPDGFAESAFFAHLTLNGASNKVAHNRWGLYLLFEDNLLLFVENFDISGYHGWFMFRGQNFDFTSEARPGEHLERHLPA